MLKNTSSLNTISSIGSIDRITWAALDKIVVRHFRSDGWKSTVLQGQVKELISLIEKMKRVNPAIEVKIEVPPSQYANLWACRIV